MSLISTQAAAYSAQVVTRYAWSVEPELSPEEESDLRETLAAALRRVMFTRALPDWIEALNHALDDWEKAHRKSGPRVDTLDEERVAMSRRR